MNAHYNALLIWIIHFVSWHLFAAGFALADHYKWLSKYKIAIDTRLNYFKILPRVLANQILIMLPIMVFIGYMDWGFQDNPQPLWVLLFHAYMLGIVHDVVFYTGHRLLHTKVGFHKLGHYLHHQSRGGTAAASMYMSPIDFVFEIILPYMIFIVIFPTNFYFNCLVASIGSVAAMYEHSGYCFTTWRPLDTRPHISHHQRRANGSFSEGVFSPGWCDFIAGSSYRQSRQKVNLRNTKR